MKKHKEKHPTREKPDYGKTSSNAQQGLDRDTAQRQQRDNMLTDTNATQSSEAASGASESSSGGDRRERATPDQLSSDAGRRGSIESPADSGSSDVDHHSGSGRDTMRTGGRGQG